MAILPQGQNKKEKDEMLRRKPELAVEENKGKKEGQGGRGQWEHTGKLPKPDKKASGISKKSEQVQKHRGQVKVKLQNKGFVKQRASKAAGNHGGEGNSFQAPPLTPESA